MSEIVKVLRKPNRSMNHLTLIGACLALLLWAVGSPAPAMAQNFPAKLVRIVVPIAAGGNQDIVARGVAQKLTEQLGQQVIVENRPSASGILGTNFVAKAPPDGYTYLSISNTFAATPAVVRNASYDPVKDFAGVSVVARVPLLLVVIPTFPASSVKELIALAKRRPNELTYGSAGNGSNPHLATELFSHLAGIKMTHIPYKGSGPAATDLIAGQVKVGFPGIAIALPNVKAGRLRALGVTSARRSAEMPDVPSIAEAGVKGYDATLWVGVAAPKATPAAIIRKLHDDVAKLAKLPDVRKSFAASGTEVSVSDSPEQFGAYMKEELHKWAKVVKDTGLQVN